MFSHTFSASHPVVPRSRLDNQLTHGEARVLCQSVFNGKRVLWQSLTYYGIICEVDAHIKSDDTTHPSSPTPSNTNATITSDDTDMKESDLTMPSHLPLPSSSKSPKSVSGQDKSPLRSSPTSHTPRQVESSMPRPHTNEDSKEETIRSGSVIPTPVPKQESDEWEDIDKLSSPFISGFINPTPMPKLESEEEYIGELSGHFELQMDGARKADDVEGMPSVQALPGHADDGNHMHVDDVNNSPLFLLHSLGFDEDNNESAEIEGELEKCRASQLLASIDRCLKRLDRMVRGNGSNPSSSNTHITINSCIPPKPKARTKSEVENSYHICFQFLIH
ncbi:hypothetical protein K439DRAFT_1616406 [Ramaria rubella]|nr:hypothetical protein K439DRAFT_1616406 [Ramaria rubella]